MNCRLHGFWTRSVTCTDPILNRATQGCICSICVIAEGLGCLHWRAHAAKHLYFSETPLRASAPSPCHQIGHTKIAQQDKRHSWPSCVPSSLTLERLQAALRREHLNAHGTRKLFEVILAETNAR